MQLDIGNDDEFTYDDEYYEEKCFNHCIDLEIMWTNNVTFIGHKPVRFSIICDSVE